MFNSTTRQALYHAMILNDSKQFRKILNAKGWPPDSPWSDYELLVIALQNNRKMIARVILDEGARTWNPNCCEDTPLHVVSSLGFISSSIVSKLLKCGARVDVKNSTGETPLHFAFDMSMADNVINLMLASHVETRKVDVVNEHGLSFLHIACARSDLNIVKSLVNFQVNAQVSVKSGKYYAGYTALHFAVRKGKYEIVEYLIEEGADINHQDCSGTTPLHLALIHRNPPIIDILFAHDKEKKNIINKHGLSHLMVACAGSERRVVQFHLENSLALHPLNHVISDKFNSTEIFSDYTLLHFAVDLGQIQIVEYLLELGANCCGATRNGLTPHLLAERRKDERIGSKLRKHCEIVSKCIKMRSEEADVGVWGDDYEKHVLTERVKEVKRMQTTLAEFRRMRAGFEGA